MAHTQGLMALGHGSSTQAGGVAAHPQGPVTDTGASVVHARGRRLAAIAVGSTSVHLTVAAVSGSRLRTLADESALLQLGAALDASGHLPAASLGELIATLRGFVGTARALGAGQVTLVGTEPLRRAGNGHSVSAEVHAATGLPLLRLTHEEEALLSLLAVLGGRPAAAPTLVVDIGGGSSEYVLAAPREAPRAHALRLGAASLTRQVARHDPPTPDELEGLRAEARRHLASAPDLRPARAILVGGTATNLLRVAAPGRALRVVDRRRLRVAMEALLAEPSADLAVRCAIRPERARILPGGAALVEAFLDRYGLRSAAVSIASIREGAILAVAASGASWRERLADLVAGN